MIKDLVKSTDKVLGTVTERFDFNNPPEDPIQLSRNLTETMLAHGGIGLSANQVGLKYRVCVIAANPVIAMFNPIIVDMSLEQIELEEGCLSYPGLILMVSRPKTIRIRYTMPNNETLTRRLEGLSSRIVQHELMHLDGIKFTDMVGKVELSIAKRKATKLVKKPKSSLILPPDNSYIGPYNGGRK